MIDTKDLQHNLASYERKGEAAWLRGSIIVVQTRYMRISDAHRRFVDNTLSVELSIFGVGTLSYLIGQTPIWTCVL